MKVRQGFVSNSSTSSFLIYGACVSKHDFPNEQAFEDLRNDNIDGLVCHNIEGTCYAGRSWSAVRDDQTGLQFKQEVAARLAEVLGKPIECTTISEAWYN
jgi:hypothetical protein